MSVELELENRPQTERILNSKPETLDPKPETEWVEERTQLSNDLQRALQEADKQTTRVRVPPTPNPKTKPQSLDPNLKAIHERRVSRL